MWGPRGDDVGPCGLGLRDGENEIVPRLTGVPQRRLQAVLIGKCQSEKGTASMKYFQQCQLILCIEFWNSLQSSFLSQAKSALKKVKISVLLT